VSDKTVDLRRNFHDDPEQHEYEPGEVHHAMHTDTLCRICGYPKKNLIHEVEEVDESDDADHLDNNGQRGY